MTTKKPLQMTLARYLTSNAPPQPGRAVVDYITAGNGIFKRAASDLFCASIPVVETRPGHIHGLRNLDPYILMRYGKIPAALLMRAISWSRRASPNEAMFHVRVLDRRFCLCTPTQNTTPGGVAYKDDHPPDNAPIVMDIHSHHSMRACFSATDDRDELGFRLYCTLGHLQKAVPQVAVRLGVYGDWLNVRVVDVFDFGPIADAFVSTFVEDVHEH